MPKCPNCGTAEYVVLDDSDNKLRTTAGNDGVVRPLPIPKSVRGAALGAAIGTAVPVVGTVIGAVVGGVAGSVVGSISSNSSGNVTATYVCQKCHRKFNA